MKKRIIVFIIGWAVALSAFSIKIPARAISIDDSGFTQADVETLQKFTEWSEGQITSWANPTNGITQAQADALYFGIGDTDGITVSTNSSGLIEVVDIPTNIVDTTELVDDAVTTAKILDNAVTADKIADAVIFVPTGAVLSFAMTNAPAGFLECDGASLLRAGAYSNLYATIGVNFGTADGTHFNLPDLRGEFIRGYDHGATNDPDAATRTAMATGGTTGDDVGSVQTYQVGEHTHTTGAADTPTGGSVYNVDGNDGINTSTSESRPRNVCLMYCIKY